MMTLMSKRINCNASLAAAGGVSRHSHQGSLTKKKKNQMISVFFIKLKKAIPFPRLALCRLWNQWLAVYSISDRIASLDMKRAKIKMLCLSPNALRPRILLKQWRWTQDHSQYYPRHRRLAFSLVGSMLKSLRLRQKNSCSLLIH